MYPFSQSVSFGWSIYSIYIKWNYEYAGTYCYFLNCFGFIILGLFLPFLFCSLLLWFADSLQLLFGLLFLFYVSIVVFWFTVPVRLWHSNLNMYRIGFGCWFFNFSFKCIWFFFFFAFSIIIITIFYLFAVSWAFPAAYGGSQARGWIGAVVAGLCQSHSNVGSRPHLQPTPQLRATLDP